jgi:hypothetical protein
VGQHLFIVSRQQPDLYSYLTREFSEEPDVRVILDRRYGDRRQNGGEALAHGERRQGQRREKPDVAGQLSTLGYAFVRLE